MDLRVTVWAMALLLAGLGLLAYGNTLDGAWVWDDASSVLLHKHVQDPSQFFQLFREDQHAFGRGAGNFYRPLVSVSFMIDYWLSFNPALDAAPDLPYPGVKPLLFHLSNIGWHVAAAFFLALLLVRFGSPVWVRVAAPVIFVLHPLHTEAVAYISGRADMMSGTFMFAGLCLATVKATPGRVPWAAYAGALACFVCGLLSKESTLVFPVLLLLVVLFRVAEEGVDPQPFFQRRGALPLVASGAVLLVYAVLRSTILKFNEAAAGVSTAATFGQRVIETLQALSWYVQLLFWPTHLHMERTMDGATMFDAVLGALFLVAMIGGAVIAWRAGHRRIALGLVWFLATWLPISGLFPLNAPMAEHWLYVPMAGFWWALLEVVALATSGLSDAMTVRRWAATAAVAALALVLLHATTQRNEDWGSNERLFRATLAENPNTLRVAYNLAVTYEDLDHNPAGARRLYEQIVALYEKSPLPGGGLRPDEAEVRLSLGRQLIKQGEYSEAIGQLSKLVPLSRDPQQAALVGQALLSIGQCSLALGEVAQADRAFRGATQLVPALEPLVGQMLDGGRIFPR